MLKRKTGGHTTPFKQKESVFLPNTSVPTDIATLEMVATNTTHVQIVIRTQHVTFLPVPGTVSAFQLWLLSSLMAHQTLASKAITNWVHLAMMCSRGCCQSCPAMEIKITQPPV